MKRILVVAAVALVSALIRAYSPLPLPRGLVLHARPARGIRSRCNAASEDAPPAEAPLPTPAAVPIAAPPSPAPSPAQWIVQSVRSALQDKRFSRDSIAKLGGYILLSYGFVSNISYITCVIISWIIHGRATGLSPLAKGQWKPFLAIYAGLWAANNVLRPLRFSVSVVIAPFFETIIAFIQVRQGHDLLHNLN